MRICFIMRSLRGHQGACRSTSRMQEKGPVRRIQIGSAIQVLVQPRPSPWHSRSHARRNLDVADPQILLVARIEDDLHAMQETTGLGVG